MKSLDFGRYALTSCVAAAWLSGCGGSQPPIGAPGTWAQAVESVRQEVATPAVTDQSPLLAVTRRVDGTLEPSHIDKVVKVREFQLPDKQVATDSIIVGPNHNVWFTEFCAIGQITSKGRIRTVVLDPGQAYPGLLTIGPDGNVWANAAQTPAPSSCSNSKRHGRHLTYYQISRVTPDGRLTTFPLPMNTDSYATGLLNIESNLYFGLPILAIKRGDEKMENFLTTISTTDGVIQKLALIHRSRSVGNGYIMILRTPGPKIWLYDFEGGLHVCSTAGECFYRLSAYPYKFVDQLYGTAMAYSPADQDVYIDNQNTYTIIRYTRGGKPLRGYKNLAFAQGFGTVTYYRGDIWITLGGDDKARPNLGRLTPSGAFSEVSLPFVGPTAAITALAGGPDGHLWYLRGYHVGEILSKI